MLKETVEKTDEMGSWQATLELWRRPSLAKGRVHRSPLALQLAVAIWPIDFLSTTLLQAHFSTDVAQVSSLTFVSTNFVASLIGMMIVEKCGRRKLLIGAGIANTLCLVAYMISDRLAFHAHTSFKYGCIASLVAFAFTYGFGLGGIAYIISSEIAPQRFRSLVQSVVFFVNTVSNFLFSFASLPLYRLIDVWSFLPLFIIPSCLSLVYLYFNMPETRNREIHEIVEQMSTGSRSPTSSHLSTSSDNSVSVKTLDSAETLSTDESEEKPAAQYSSNLRLAQELEAGKELDGKKEVV
ncbi:MFS domain-containing protein [Aphelenchoides fujianensis]|nr:MFS domain-containing protein [Aphelenchoides fujianensis]